MSTETIKTYISLFVEQQYNKRRRHYIQRKRRQMRASINDQIYQSILNIDQLSQLNRREGSEVQHRQNIKGQFAKSFKSPQITRINSLSQSENRNRSDCILSMLANIVGSNIQNSRQTKNKLVFQEQTQATVVEKNIQEQYNKNEQEYGILITQWSRTYHTLIKCQQANNSKNLYYFFQQLIDKAIKHFPNMLSQYSFQQSDSQHKQLFGQFLQEQLQSQTQENDISKVYTNICIFISAALAYYQLYQTNTKQQTSQSGAMKYFNNQIQQIMLHKVCYVLYLCIQLNEQALTTLVAYTLLNIYQQYPHILKFRNSSQEHSIIHKRKLTSYIKELAEQLPVYSQIDHLIYHPENGSMQGSDKFMLTQPQKGQQAAFNDKYQLLIFILQNIDCNLMCELLNFGMMQTLFDTHNYALIRICSQKLKLQSDSSADHQLLNQILNNKYNHIIQSNFLQTYKEHRA